MNLSKNSKILAILHNDLDAVGSGILLSHVFKDISFIFTSFNKIDQYLIKINYDLYNYIILADIFPENKALVNISNKLIILDHHESNINENDPLKYHFVNIKNCASILVKNFLEKYFNIDLSKYDLLCDLINDYDMWYRKDKRSWALNEIFYNIGTRRFMYRFMNGNINFTEDEMIYIKSRNNQYIREYDNLEVMELKKINGCLIFASDFTNDFASDLLLKEKYKIVFIYNQLTETVSIRQCLDELNIGKFLSDLKIGGGHAKAAGMKKINKDLIQRTIILLEKLLYEKYEGIRKQ
jgi:oligoribonuclease NrnB/cAMP/cGMP phosphodiesterase (DHH superfamily)